MTRGACARFGSLSQPGVSERRLVGGNGVPHDSSPHVRRKRFCCVRPYKHARNQLKGTVKSVITVTVMAEVLVDVGG